MRIIGVFGYALAIGLLAAVTLTAATADSNCVRIPAGERAGPSISAARAARIVADAAIMAEAGRKLRDPLILIGAAQALGWFPTQGASKTHSKEALLIQALRLSRDNPSIHSAIEHVRSSRPRAAMPCRLILSPDDLVEPVALGGVTHALAFAAPTAPDGARILVSDQNQSRICETQFEAGASHCTLDTPVEDEIRLVDRTAGAEISVFIE